jgi:SAM-dependent methyltransferase
MKEKLKRFCSKSAVRTFSLLRELSYRALQPFDYTWLSVNGKNDLPPLHLRGRVGPLRSFETAASEFMVYLKIICQLDPSERVLDIGCGCGALALPLLEYLDSKSSYRGLDIDKGAIDWCRRKISARCPNFTFQHIDVRNGVYNPNGRYESDNYSLPLDDGMVDVILVKSVFTHLLPLSVDNYLSQVARLLAPSGRCLATFFLLNDRTEELARQKRAKLYFDFGEGSYRYAYETTPESAVAYRESDVRQLLYNHRLTLREPIHYGSWSGFESGLSYQDIMVITKV